MSTNIAVRHRQILEKLKADGSVSVAELSKVFNVSAVTIRKDLKLLENKNLLFRSHGRAIPSNPYVVEQSVTEKEKIHIAEKSRIAAAALSTVESSDSIILASGTSVTEFANQLKQTGGITVLTASLKNALVLSENPNIEVIQLGGSVRKSSSSVIGPIGEKILADFTCTKLFLGVDGIDIDYGLTTTSLMEASLNKTMIKSAQKTIVLADSSKFGRKGFGRICGLDEIDQIITDSGIDEKIQTSLADMGVELTVV